MRTHRRETPFYRDQFHQAILVCSQSSSLPEPGSRSSYLCHRNRFAAMSSESSDNRNLQKTKARVHERLQSKASHNVFENPEIRNRSLNPKSYENVWTNANLKYRFALIERC